MKCYLCGKNNLMVIRTKVRHDISRNVFKCHDCGVVYLEPNGKDSKAYYERDDYKKLYSPTIGKTLSAREVFDMLLPYQQLRINEIKHILNPRMKVLDVGCSSGYFLHAMKNHVQECVGIEFNKEEAIFASEELGIKTYTEPIQDTGIPFEYFDLITIYQVLEHIDDPIQFLITINKYLKSDGFLCIEVPNIQDVLISMYKIEAYVNFWFREPHLFYFSPKTLSMVLERSGFSGSTKTSQEYNFINHLSWILTQKPLKTMTLGISKPRLIDSESVNPIVKTEFNNWIHRTDEEYRELLNKYDLGENIIFIGKKSN